MIIAIDIGGTKTIVATIEDDGTIVSEQRFGTSHNTAQFMRNLKAALAKIIISPSAVSVAAAGLIDSERGIIVYSPKLSWTDFPLKSILQEDYDCPIYLENDANIAALASVRALENTPELALYITLGTSIGTGVIARGQLDNALARSEGGHMVFQTDKGLQTWESFASGRAIAEEFGQLAVEITDQETWDKVAKHLAVGLRALIPMLRPDVIIFGGGVGTSFPQYQAPLEKTLRTQLPNFIPMPTLLQAKDPEKAVIHGCYHYAYEVSHLSTATRSS